MSESVVRDLEPVRAAVETMLGCPVAITHELGEFLEAFEEANCFTPELQPAFTRAHLSGFLADLVPGTIHELVEPLGMAVTALHLDGTIAVIGPYTEHPLHPGEAESVLGGLGIPAAHLQAYKLHRTRFPIVDSEYVRRAAGALLRAEGSDPDSADYERTEAETGPLHPGARKPPHSASFEVINERYAVEDEFMHAVAGGDEQAALAALQKMPGIPQAPSYLLTPFLGATIIRIMARVAAHQGGLPPVTVDAISQTYAQRMHRSGHTRDYDASLNSITAMVGEFCRAVRRHNRRPYSRLVRQALDEVELHLSHNVSSRDIAVRLHVSESHLARRFKAETGGTISEHVATERVRIAAHLLSTTNQPVRDIAAYVGYPDANYFVKVFRTARGVTPTQYRRQQSTRR